MSKMRKTNSSNHKEKDKDNDSIFSSNLSLLTDKQRVLIESIRREYLPQVLKDQGLLEEDNKADSMINDVEKLVQEMEFVLKHHQRTQKIELNLIKLWESYTNEIDPIKREIIHEHLVAFQILLICLLFCINRQVK